MASSLDKLDPRMKEKVLQVLDACEERGVEMRAGEGLRDPLTQARYWRRSRTTAEVNAKINEFKAAGAPFLAKCIEYVGPQKMASEITKTPPGLSWHQWGEALDCMWIHEGETKAASSELNGYHVYAVEAEEAGLTAGGHWETFKDWPHVQLRRDDNAGSVMSLKEIDAEMASRFGSLVGWQSPTPGTTTSPESGASLKADIEQIVQSSEIRSYPWIKRGRSPIGYLKGMALMFARSYSELRSGQNSAVSIMCQPLGGAHRDALTHYGLPIDSLNTEAERLRAVYTLAIGLGMSESSGNTTEGRDLSVSPDKVSESSAEAGLFQVSYDSFHVSPWMTSLYDDYGAGRKDSLLSVFMEGVNDKHRPLVGSGKGAAFQKLTKECPAFATEYVMLMLRLNRSHFGPINRKQTEYKPEADEMLKAVQDAIDGHIGS